MLIVIGLVLPACREGESIVAPSIPTETHKIPITVTPTVTFSSTPTETTTPTQTFTNTPSPTITPSPTPTSILVSAPLEIELSGLEHAERPKLSGVVRYVETKHFRIFYTLSGEDAVIIKDKNGDAVPDFVEEVAEAVEHSWKVQIDENGWAEPVPDLIRGGNDLFDIYLEDLDQYLVGYVDFAETWRGDNPATIWKELRAAPTYMGLDNDFQEAINEGDGISALEWMQTTVAHELNHAIQAGYDSQEPLGWLWEATSTWMETIAYPEIKDPEFHLIPSFKSPDTCMSAYGGDKRLEDQGHWYALWLFLQFITEQTEKEVIREIWEQARFVDGYTTLEEALSLRDTNLEDIYRDYTVALLLHNFEFDLPYPTVRLEASLDSEQTFSPKDGIWQMGADYLEIEMDGIIKISLRGLEHGTLVGLRGSEADLFPLEDKTVTVDAGDYQHLYLIIYNLERAAENRDCRETQYTVQILTGENQQIPAKTITALHFKVPAVEPLQVPNTP